MTIPRVLVVAGSDSGGGAGIQADIKTITALGGYAATAITALTAQDTLGVHGIMPVPPAFVAQQMRVVLQDIGADAIKMGMLLDAKIVEACAAVIMADARSVPLIIDPVMVSTSGSKLLQEDAVAALSALLIPVATVLTPNLPEAEVLLGRTIADSDAMVEAARELLGWGPKAVVLKGGHLSGDLLVDVLASDDVVETFEARRLIATSSHGTGCTLASAIAVSLGGGLPIREAVVRARDYVRAAIATAPNFGKGNGPLNHMHRETSR